MRIFGLLDLTSILDPVVDTSGKVFGNYLNRKPLEPLIAKVSPNELTKICNQTQIVINMTGQEGIVYNYSVIRLDSENNRNI